MGTKLHCKSYFPGNYPMRDLNDDSNSGSWPLFYGDKNVSNGQHCSESTPRTITDAYPGCDKNALKQRMLEHEAIFRNQVYELHRVYRIQRDMMEEIKRKDLHRHRVSIEPSSSSSLLGSQAPREDTRKWHVSSYPLTNNGHGRSTLSGVDIVKASPLSCTKGNNNPASRVTSQNGSISKEREVSEARPSKMRKKLFDLDLPADEYIDTEDAEQTDDKKTDISGEYLVGSESTMKLSLGGVARGKTGGHGEALARDSRFRSSVRLADLNEPFEVEDSPGPSSVDIFGNSSYNGGVKGINLSTKSNSMLLKEVMQRSQEGSNNGFLKDWSIENKVNGREWLSNGLQRDKLPFPSSPAHMVNQINSRAIHLNDHSKEDSCRERAGWGLEASDKFHNSNYSSDFSGTWPQFVSSLWKPSYNTHCNGTSAQSRDVLGGTWKTNGSYTFHPGLGTDSASRIGIHPGSSSGTKDLPVCFPSVNFNYLNGCRNDNTTSKQSNNHGLEKSQKGSNNVEENPRKDMNLNVAFVNSSLNKGVPRQDLEIVDERSKREDHQAVLPWLRAKPAGKNEGTKSSVGKNETVKDLNQMLIGISASNDSEIKPEETSETRGGKKLLGFPIFENFRTSKNDPSSLISSTATRHPTLEGENVKHERRNMIIDINVACDDPFGDEMVMEKALDKNSNCVRNFIDLNSCVSEDEEPPVPVVASNLSSVKAVVEIDLEAPPVPEVEEDILPEKETEQEETALQPPDDKIEQAEDEILKSAAEAIVDISSINDSLSSNAPSAKTLLWFADVVVLSADKFGNESFEETKGKDCGSDKGGVSEMDDFESMTLQLPETKEEHYMPSPFVSELQNMEETETKSLPSRTRRGQARRGRQRRDFQRDVLPGLASLSRNEVTEDLQTFGGLMKATGHSWDSGLTRRNGGTRGRRRTVVETPPTATPSAAYTPLVQQLNNTETGLENRSLTGWGKTPRRPRRPRCPAGNLPTIPSA